MMKATWLDKAVSWFDPRAGLKRVQARAAADAMLRYDGAARGRRTSNWNATGTSANAENGPDLPNLRARSRDLQRNNPTIRRALRSLNANTVGKGIIPQADTGNAALNQQIDAAYGIWKTECDADGQLTFEGLERLIDATIRLSGEVIIRDRYRRIVDGLHVPYQIQVLEPDYLDSSRQYWPNDSGGPTVAGVAFDQLGKRSGYWLFGWHPGDVVRANKDGFVSKLIPADQVTHVYEKERPGQVRGVPMLASAMMTAYDLDGYFDALQMKAKIAACFGIAVEQAEGSEGPSLGGQSTDQNGNRIETIEPGMIQYLKPGEKISAIAPADTSGTDAFIGKQQHRLAAGAGVTYGQMTMDLSQESFSSHKAGQIEVRADIEAYRKTVLIEMCLQRIWQKFIDAAFTAGKISERDYGVKWTPPPWQSVQPVEDGEAELLALRVGTKTWDQAVIEKGHDPEAQMGKIIARKKQLDAAGIMFDFEVDKVDRRTGAFQKAPTEGGTNAKENATGKD
ncbi:MAG TPA: phage portal protein [Bryobacteraceae bacterium]|jgi:lambda family phage portal protein